MAIDTPAKINDGDITADALRDQTRSWLASVLPKGWMEAIDSGDTDTYSKLRSALSYNDWCKTLGESGYATPTWPAEYGAGLSLNPGQARSVNEVLNHYRVPRPFNIIGIGMGGPTLIACGTEEQKMQFLRPLATNEEIWCQLFSEPGAGSDVAGLATRAVRDGDEWIINGQKVWTTQGHHADYCFLLTRTDKDSPKHKGISYLLVPMKQPGIEVRGITQPDGTAEFCEVFFTDARCPKDNVVGGVNNGWKVANSTLAFERGMSATTGYRRFEEEYKLFVAQAKANGKINDASIRQRLMQYYAKIQILRFNGLRSLSSTLAGTKDFGVMALGASNKMYWSEMHQSAMELALDIYGPYSMLVDTGPESGTWPGALRDKRRAGYPSSPMMSSFFFSRSETIWGGTSQIQRNIVGERVLALPKEPKPAGGE